MAHRGPDDRGVYLSGDNRLGLGFRRLSIVDLSAAGHQPMANEDESVWVVANGEIYNHIDLRKELEAAGHRFRSRTDVESLVHGYEEWGEGLVNRLHGMFAFAVWDERTGQVFMARDRIGIKPFYYAEVNGVFLFASEIKSILEWPGMYREVDYEAVSHYLTLASTPSTLTMFKDVRKLPPGHSLTVSLSGEISTKRYWEPLPLHDRWSHHDETEIVERLREMLRESIRLRMMSDVDFGVFLSGGLDSSLNVALMSELMDEPVRTFSVAVEGDRQSDERDAARQVATAFATDHHEITIQRQDFIDFLPQMVWHQDEPLADPVCVPLYFVSRLARDHGTIVVQVGEGSDEIFAGYDLYTLMERLHRRWVARFERLPRALSSVAAQIANRVLPESKSEFFRRAADGQEFFWGGSVVFADHAKAALWRRGESARTYEDVIAPTYSRFERLSPGRTFLERITYLELNQRLPELLLARVDKMTMAASVEARVPFLDHELVEFALSIPPGLRIKNNVGKHLLRKAARGIVPSQVLARPKRGFCGSASNMVRGEIVDFAEDAIVSSQWMSELLYGHSVTSILAEHRSGARDHGMAIWCLLNLALWHRVWFE